MGTSETMFVLHPLEGKPPATLFATVAFITETSTPNAQIPVLQFDASTDEYMDWIVTVPDNYGGGGFDISWKGGASGTDTGSFELEISMAKITDGELMTADQGLDTATPAAVTDTPGGTASEMNYAAAVSLSHANAGSPSVGDFLIIRAQRDTAADTNTGDLQLAEILITET